MSSDIWARACCLVLFGFRLARSVFSDGKKLSLAADCGPLQRCSRHDPNGSSRRVIKRGMPVIGHQLLEGRAGILAAPVRAVP